MPFGNAFGNQINTVAKEVKKFSNSTISTQICGFKNLPSEIRQKTIQNIQSSISCSVTQNEGLLHVNEDEISGVYRKENRIM